MIWLAVFRKLYNHRYQPRTITCRNFANYYLTSLNDLQSNNFEPVFNSSSVNEAWSFLKSILKKCIDGHAPIIRDCLAPRPLSFDENVRAKEGGKETTGETCFAFRAEKRNEHARTFSPSSPGRVWKNGEISNILLPKNKMFSFVCFYSSIKTI